MMTGKSDHFNHQWQLVVLLCVAWAECLVTCGFGLREDVVEMSYTLKWTSETVIMNAL